MDSDPARIIHDFPPFFRVDSTGHVYRYMKPVLLPPSHDPETGVTSRDVLISPEKNVSVRIFLPETTEDDRRLPLIVYILGGAFSTGSAFASAYHNYANTLASASRSVVVSIEYRLAPEHPIPACYDDCYDVIKWIDSHAPARNGPDPWLNGYADFNRVFMAGDSAGANIAYNVSVRAGLKFAGLILVNPFFGDGEPDELWDFICPDTGGADDVRLNPVADLDLLSKLRCNRVLVCVSELDLLRQSGCLYYQALKNSGWKGVAEFFETPGEDHVFHLLDPSCKHAFLLMKRIVGFINSGPDVGCVRKLYRQVSELFFSKCMCGVAFKRSYVIPFY